MELFYRLLGVAAWLGAKGSRRRINFIPLSFLPLFGGFIALICGLAAQDSWREGTEPHTVSLGALAQKWYTGPHFVSVKGAYELGLAFVPKFQTSTDEKAYMALIDTQSNGAIMVLMQSDRTSSPLEILKESVTVTGTLEPMPMNLAMKVPEKYNGVPISHEYYLEEGTTPGDPWTMMGIALFLGAPLLIYLPAFASKYVIFRKASHPTTLTTAAHSSMPESLDLRASGRFWLQSNQKERFLEVPAALADLPSGDLGIVANVDASRRSRFYGIPIGKEDRSGYWGILVQRGSLRELQLGQQYLGLHSRFALRFSYRDDRNSTPDYAVLSFGSELERDIVAGKLKAFAGTA